LGHLEENGGVGNDTTAQQVLGLEKGLGEALNKDVLVRVDSCQVLLEQLYDDRIRHEYVLLHKLIDLATELGLLDDLLFEEVTDRDSRRFKVLAELEGGLLGGAARRADNENAFLWLDYDEWSADV
jgi:hypothetical protein